MPISAFTDKDRQPTSRQISLALGPRRPLWQELDRFINDTYGIPGELSYGGKKYGWNVWYRRGGKSLVSLYPQRGYFIAEIVLGKDQAEKTQSLRLGKNVRQVVENAPQLHDGRWLYIRVRSRRDAKDIEEMLRIKKPPPRQPLRP